MTTEYLHGVETLEVNDGIRPVKRVKSSVIGLIGTAPDADPAVFPINTPVAIPGNTFLASQLGTGGTLPDAMRAIYAQIGAVVVVNRIEEGETTNETLARVMGDPNAKTGVWAFLNAENLTGMKPRIFCAPGFTSQRPSTGVATIAVTEGGGGYTVAPIVTIARGALDVTGAGAEAIAVIQAGAVQAIIVTNPGLGYTVTPVITIAAPPAGEDAETATATATLGTTANPVAAAFAGLCQRMRAVAFIDGPNTTNTAALSYREDFGSSRLNIIDPGVLVFDYDTSINVHMPASAYAAGIQAKMDNEKGFWWSYSNQPIAGIVGAGRPIAFTSNDRNSEHNLLNENHITTIIRDDGFRFFGVRGCDSTDPNWAFLSVRRTADLIMDEIDRSFVWALDRPFSQQLIREIIESVNAYLRLLRAEGAIVNGRCWLNPDFNPSVNLVAGKLTLDFDIEPVAPIERLTFRVHRNPEYYTGAIEEIVRALAA